METSWKGKSIIIVDDSETVREYLADLYDRVGLSIIGKFSNALDLLSKSNELDADIISLDIIMPDMHGIEAFRLLKTQLKETKFLFVTCLNSDGSFSSSFGDEIPKYSVLSKPVKQDQLQLSLSRFFEEDSPQEKQVS